VGKKLSEKLAEAAKEKGKTEVAPSATETRTHKGKGGGNKERSAGGREAKPTPDNDEKLISAWSTVG
jgi:hypothetical protein